MVCSAPLVWLARAICAAPSADRRSAVASLGRAKRIILLYLYGAAAQHETYDPKPDAPAEIRGKFRPIETAVPGVQICEHLPRLAKMADRVSFIRSMSHPYNIHSAAYTMTGVETVDIPMELDPYDTRHWPFFGSVLDYLASIRPASGRRKPADASGDGAVHHGADAPRSPLGRMEIPRNVALPFLFSSRCPQFDRGGPYGGFLGQGYNPVWTEFEGQAARHVDAMDRQRRREGRRPLRGHHAAGPLRCAPARTNRPPT